MLEYRKLLRSHIILHSDVVVDEQREGNNSVVVNEPKTSRCSQCYSIISVLKRQGLSEKMPYVFFIGWLFYFVTNIRYAARLSVYTVT